MIKPCRKVLKGLRKISRNSEITLGFLEETTCICREDDFDVVYDYFTYRGEIHSIINHLSEEGYLICEQNINFFSLTQKGLHPYRFTWDAIKHFLLTSVLIPIIVAFITSLLTLLVEGLL